ncbi:MAG: ankyrin repeat domain-containing protein, partial [Mucilaginibacter sp.]
PGDFFPVARDMSGNLLLMGATKKNYGQIFFWDHETEQEVGVKPDTSNITKTAPGLKEFIDALYDPGPASYGNLADIFNGPDDGIKALLATDWDVNKTDELGNTLLQRAVLKDKTWLVELLIGRGARPDGAIAQTMTFNNVKILDLLLKAGANIEEKDSNKNTPLQAAVIGKKTDMVGLLLKNGANKSVLDKFGRTPLDVALVKKENGEDMDAIVKLLKG